MTGPFARVAASALLSVSLALTSGVGALLPGATGATGVTVAQAAAPAAAPAAETPAAALAQLNRIRGAAGVPLATLNPTGAAALHAHYLTLNAGQPEVQGLLAHTEQPGLPGYTKEGAAAGERSNIALVGEGPPGGGAPAATPVETLIEGLVDGPIHRHWMIAPGLTTIDVGLEGGNMVVDLGNLGSAASRGKPKVVAYPGPGQQGVGLTFAGDEVPNPLTAIPGLAPDTTVGYGISLHFYGCEPSVEEGSLSRADGAGVPTYLIKPGAEAVDASGTRTISFALLFPRQPLAPGTTYVARMTASCEGLGRRTYSWPFTTRAAWTGTGTNVVVGPRASNGWQSVKVQLADAAGLAVSGASVEEWQYTYSYGAGVARPVEPQMHDIDAPSDEQGVIAFDFHLGDATNAVIKLTTVYDGRRVDVQVTLTPAASGTLKPLPSPVEFQVDRAARAPWEQTHGTEVVGFVP